MRRPRAGALLPAVEAGECRFDAVVVGEYERAFATGDQFSDVAARLGKAGVQVWLPEAGGRVDVASPAKIYPPAGPCGRPQGAVTLGGTMQAGGA